MSAKADYVVDHFDVPKIGTLFKISFIALWLFCLGSAMGVVFSTFESRQAVQELEELRREAIGLKVSSGQYQLEKSTLASFPRIESLASEKLQMAVPESSKTVLVVRE